MDGIAPSDPGAPGYYYDSNSSVHQLHLMDDGVAAMRRPVVRESPTSGAGRRPGASAPAGSRPRPLEGSGPPPPSRRRARIPSAATGAQHERRALDYPDPVSSSADPRAAYRRRLKHRQTTVIGGTLAIMTIVTVVCLMIWTGMLPTPDPGFSEKEKPTAEAQPCPPADAVTSEIVSIPVNVYNGTDSAGLASTVADVLTDAGMTVGAITDWPRGTYDGDVLITSSEAGLTNAYTLSRAFSGTVTVRIDENTDAADTTVSVVLGSEYEHTILTSGEIGQLAAGQPITAPAGCVAVTHAPSASPSAAG